MTALNLQERCQPLSAVDDEIMLAIGALDESMRAWLEVVQALEASGATIAHPGDLVQEPPPVGATPDESRTAAKPAPTPALRAEVEPPAAADAVSDEELLAGLPPEIANTVRVKRRLLGRSGDLRELIKEVEAGLDSKRKKSRRTSWWS